MNTFDLKFRKALGTSEVRLQRTRITRLPQKLDNITIRSRSKLFRQQSIPISGSTHYGNSSATTLVGVLVVL